MNIRRFLLYSVVGASGTAVQYFILYISVSFCNINSVMASTIGAAVGALVNYFLNYHITFKSITDHFSGMTKYFIVAVAAIFLNFIIMSFLVVNLQINYMIVQIFSSMITLSLAYVINARWSFYQ